MERLLPKRTYARNATMGMRGFGHPRSADAAHKGLRQNFLCFSLMADVVESSKASRAEMECFFSVVEQVNRMHPQRLLSPLTVTLGDEFQCLLKTLPDAIQVILDLEEALLQAGSTLRLRYSLKHGLVESRLNPARAHAMVGPGLTATRRMLEGLKHSGRHFAMSLSSKPRAEMLEHALEVWHGMLDEWKDSPKAMALVPAFLQHRDYKAVADHLNLNRGNVWRRAQTLRFADYLHQVRLIQLIAASPWK